MSRKREPQKREPSNADLFAWLDALFHKRTPDGTPPTFMMHRFLASERDFAEAARWLSMYVREPALVCKCWQSLLPEGQSAPRMSYVAAKKPPAEEELVTRMRQVLSERRSVVETMISIVKLAGKEAELYEEYGVVPP